MKRLHIDLELHKIPTIPSRTKPKLELSSPCLVNLRVQQVLMVKRHEEEETKAMKEPSHEGGGGGGEKEGKERDEREEGKKKEEEKEEWSEIRLAIEELSLIKCGDDHKLLFPTLPFLGLSHLLLQVLDKIGPTMAVLRLDIQRNIERLEELYLEDPSKYSTLMEIVEKEVREGTARKADSCARSVLWLTRSMDFAIALLQRLEEDSDQLLSLAQAVEAAYMSTLKPWHGWISSAAYKIALKLIPERRIFVSLLIGKGQDYAILKSEIEELVPLLQPLLDEIHALMGKFRLDRLKST